MGSGVARVAWKGGIPVKRISAPHGVDRAGGRSWDRLTRQWVAEVVGRGSLRQAEYAFAHSPRQDHVEHGGLVRADNLEQVILARRGGNRVMYQALDVPGFDRGTVGAVIPGRRAQGAAAVRRVGDAGCAGQQGMVEEKRDHVAVV